MHKIVNGKRVELTDEQAAVIEAEWEKNRLLKEEKLKAKEAEELRKLEVLKKMAEATGVGVDELKEAMK